MAISDQHSLIGHHSDSHLVRVAGGVVKPAKSLRLTAVTARALFLLRDSFDGEGPLTRRREMSAQPVRDESDERIRRIATRAVVSDDDQCEVDSVCSRHSNSSREDLATEGSPFSKRSPNLLVEERTTYFRLGRKPAAKKS